MNRRTGFFRRTGYGDAVAPCPFILCVISCSPVQSCSPVPCLPSPRPLVPVLQTNPVLLYLVSPRLVLRSCSPGKSRSPVPRLPSPRPLVPVLQSNPVLLFPVSPRRVLWFLFSREIPFSCSPSPLASSSIPVLQTNPVLLFPVPRVSVPVSFANYSVPSIAQHSIDHSCLLDFNQLWCLLRQEANGMKHAKGCNDG